MVEAPYKPKRRYSDEEEEHCNPLSDIFPEGNTRNLKPFLPEPDETNKINEEYLDWVPVTPPQERKRREAIRNCRLHFERKHHLDLTGLDNYDFNKSIGNSDLKIGPWDIDDRIQIFGNNKIWNIFIPKKHTTETVEPTETIDWKPQSSNEPPKIIQPPKGLSYIKKYQIIKYHW